MIHKIILLLPLLVGTSLAAPAPSPVPQHHNLGLSSSIGQRMDNFNGNRIGTTNLGVATAYAFKKGPHTASVTAKYDQTRSTHFDTNHNAGVRAGYGYTNGRHNVGVRGDYGRTWGGSGGASDNWGANVGYTLSFRK